jgi:hypothetical protein
MLVYSDANAKTKALYDVPELAHWLGGGRKVVSLDLLSGFSCPFAEECLSKAVTLENGRRKIKDGPKTKFRCFSASQEVQYTGVYNRRSKNYKILKPLSTSSMVDLLAEAMPKKTGIVRIHVAGDFFNQKYFDAWVSMANRFPHILFYAYTKSLRYWVARLDEIPYNLVLTASMGGREDYLADDYSLRKTHVIFSENEAATMGLEIDHSDEHAAVPEWRENDFALLIHGTQPKGSDAAVALKELKGVGSYS